MAEITADLSRLVSDFGTPEKVRHHADALLKRLGTPIKISICGPDKAAVSHLMGTLPQVVTGAALSNQLSGADIAVWCTQSFDMDEVSFWESAPVALQDHSLLVGPSDPHIHMMGASYFRQFCDVSAVGGILQRQLKQGREADMDQAMAVLARHPAKRADIQPPKPQIADLPTPCDISAYLQNRADALAAMTVQDTAESCGAVLDHCAQTAQHLGELVTSHPDQALQDAVFDGADAITLMVIEGDLGAATDAVTILINLKAKFQGGVRQLETNTVQ